MNKNKKLEIAINRFKNINWKDIRWHIYRWFNSDNFAVLFLICAWIAAITIYIWLCLNRESEYTFYLFELVRK